MRTTRLVTVEGGGVYVQGVCVSRGYHVTYPIMHLMLPVFCPWTTETDQLPI